MKVLLVEPEFPIPAKSKNHKNFLPIGLLKLAAYHRNQGHKVKLVRGNVNRKDIRFKPNEIFITSLFTYWSKYVKESVAHYNKLYPESKIVVGGIYASLMPSHCKKYTGCDEVFKGIHKEAEEYAQKNGPAYDLVNNGSTIDYQIIHGSRGCFRKCEFCGTWRIEPKFTYKDSILSEIKSNKLVFYDNNLLKNPNIDNLLAELVDFRYDNRPVICESQSGFDGRLLTLERARLLKTARFKTPRIAWDWAFDQNKSIKKQIDTLVKAGYPPKEIYVFMLYNWKMPFKEMEKKRKKCWKWGVQISDCRYRPLTQTFDNYSPLKEQTNEDYFIHGEWTDTLVKQFRRNVRRQNICVRQGLPFYSASLERKQVSKAKTKKLRNLPSSKVKKKLPDVWFPHWSK